MRDTPQPDTVEAYDYNLPPHLIAHQPAAERAKSRLMVCGAGERHIGSFGEEILKHLREGDLLVFNDTRVVPCRLQARKATGGRVEVFVLSPLEGDRGWNAPLSGRGALLNVLTRSNKPLKAGIQLSIEDHGGADASITLENRREDGSWEARLQGEGVLLDWIEAAGQTPLPPYIVSRRKSLGEPEVQEGDKRRYQTVYAKNPGAVAAPTAGLHFQDDLLKKLQDQGVELGFLTLHVGMGTFKPLTEGTLEGKELHNEAYIISPTLAAQLQSTLERGGRVFSVGTTSTRALEDQGQRWGAPLVKPGVWNTRLFIKPGFAWRVVSGVVTNFHLPKSSLLVLVASWMGHQPMHDAYREALAEEMRFYSYGDAMLLLPESRETHSDQV